jgi:hypothetical protein
MKKKKKSSKIFQCINSLSLSNSDMNTRKIKQKPDGPTVTNAGRKTSESELDIVYQHIS